MSILGLETAILSDQSGLLTWHLYRLYFEVRLCQLGEFQLFRLTRIQESE
jgi:hypothetical protein